VYPSRRRIAESCGLEHGQVASALEVATLPVALLAVFSSPTLIKARFLRPLAHAIKRDSEVVLRRAAQLASGKRLAPAKAVAALCVAKRLEG
jgi:ParB family chromosome partitioning protein